MDGIERSMMRSLVDPALNALDDSEVSSNGFAKHGLRVDGNVVGDARGLVFGSKSDDLVANKLDGTGAELEYTSPQCNCIKLRLSMDGYWAKSIRIFY